MKRLNWNCRSEAPISKNACEARDEIVAEMEKECNENDTKRCADLAYISYGFLMGDWYGEYRNVIQSYKAETDRIYPAKFKVAANKACDAGWISSCMELAFFHYDYEPERNFNLVRQYGKKLYLRLKDAKNRGTLREGLAREYLITLAGMEAVLDDSDKDERKQFAINYFKVGCDDSEEAWVCYKFAEIIYDKGEDDYNSKNGRRNYEDVANINQKDALHYYDKACVLGGVGCAELAQKYLWGDYVGDKKLKPNLAKLRHYLIKDCDFGDKESCFAKGLNDKELYERAKSYFDDHSCGGCDDDECE